MMLQIISRLRRMSLLVFFTMTFFWFTQQPAAQAANAIPAVLDTVQASTFSKLEPWRTIPDLPRPATGTAGVFVDGTFYVVGGEIGSHTANPYLQAFDPVTNQWDLTLPQMPQPVRSVCAAALGKDIYVMGGFNDITFSTVQVFHITTRSWEVVTTDPMIGAWEGAACAAVNGRLYVIGGEDSYGWRSHWAYVYDPQSPPHYRWQVLPFPPTSSAFGNAAVIGSLIYCGDFDNGRIFAYDVSSNTWTELPPFKQARRRARLWALGTKLYIGAGEIGSGYTTSVEVYDTQMGLKGQWAEDTPMQTPRYDFAAASDPGTNTVYVAGGWNSWYTFSSESTQAGPYGIYIEPTNLTIAGTPGLTVTAMLQVTNMGIVSDTFALTVEGGTWPTVMPTVSELAAGQSTTLRFATYIAPEIPLGTIDTFTITLTSQGDTAIKENVQLTIKSGLNQIFLPHLTH